MVKNLNMVLMVVVLGLVLISALVQAELPDVTFPNEVPGPKINAPMLPRFNLWVEKESDDSVVYYQTAEEFTGIKLYFDGSFEHNMLLQFSSSTVINPLGNNSWSAVPNVAENSVYLYGTTDKAISEANEKQKFYVAAGDLNLVKVSDASDEKANSIASSVISLSPPTSSVVASPVPIDYGKFLASSSTKVSHWESIGSGISPRLDTGSGSNGAQAQYAPTELLSDADSALLTNLDWVARVDWNNHGQVGASGDQSIFRADSNSGQLWNFFRQGAGTFALDLLGNYQWFDESLATGDYTLTAHYRAGDGQIDFYLNENIIHTENIAAASADLKKIILRKNTNDGLRDGWSGLRVSNIPEPVTAVLIGLGGVMLWVRRRRKIASEGMFTKTSPSS